MAFRPNQATGWSPRVSPLHLPSGVKMSSLIFGALILVASTLVQAASLTAVKIQQYLRAAQTESPSYRDIPGTLTTSPAFTALWSQPDEIIHHARSLMLSPNLTTEDKLVLVFAVQNGRWQDLLALYEWAFDCYTRGLLPSRLVEALIFPSSDWNTRLQLRYQEPRVRNLRVRGQRSRLPQEEEWLAQYIVDVLSGKAVDGLNAARRDGQLRDWNRKD